MEEEKSQQNEFANPTAQQLMTLAESHDVEVVEFAHEKSDALNSGGEEPSPRSSDGTLEAASNETVRVTKTPRPNVAPATFTKVEKSLASLGFFTPSSRRIKEQKVKRISFIREVDGKRVERTGEILPSALFGLPVTADQDKYLALQEIITRLLESEGELKNPIKFKSAELLRLLGRDRNAGKNYNEIGEWLDVMSSTTIKSNDVVYNAGQKRFATDRFHVFDRAVSVGKELEDGTIADANYVWLSQWQLQNINQKFLLPVDFATYRELKNRIAKALVPLLQIWLFASQKAGSFEKRYDELCEFLTLQKYSALSQIVRQWKPSLDELQRFGYLERWQVEKTTDRKAYKIIFFHGPKFHRDGRRRLEQKHKIEASMVVYVSDPPEPVLPQPGKAFAADPSAPEQLGGGGDARMKVPALTNRPASVLGDQETGEAVVDLIDELSSRGVVRVVAEKLLNGMPIDRHQHIRDCIEYWDSAKDVGAGFLYELVKSDRPLPATFTPRRVLEARKREAEQDAQKQFVEDLLKRRYDDYRQATIDRFIADRPPEDFERRVTERLQELSIVANQDPSAPWNSPAALDRTAHFTVRAEIANEASLMTVEDFRKQELPRIQVELQLEGSFNSDLAA